MNYTISLLAIILFSTNIYAQDLEGQMLKQIAEELLIIKQENKYRKTLVNVLPLADPVSGSTELYYQIKPTDKVKELIKTIGEDSTYNLLSHGDIPVEFINDSVYILDTIGFFQNGITYSYSQNNFTIIKTLDKSKKHSLSLYGVGRKADMVSLFFKMSNYPDALVFTYKYKKNKVTLVKRGFVQMYWLKQHYGF